MDLTLPQRTWYFVDAIFLDRIFWYSGKKRGWKLKSEQKGGMWGCKTKKAAILVKIVKNVLPCRTNNLYK
jgi:hypothetical protein